MAYFNYHATAKQLIMQGKLLEYHFCEKYNSISPAMVLVFDDTKHPVMPIRQEKWDEYLKILQTKNES
jgi:hypothetical protein